MKIKLIELEKPNVEKVAFNCDEKLCDSLDKFPMVRDNLNTFKTSVILGRQGSGKTSLTINIIKKLYKKKFHKIYIFMPRTSMASLKNNIFDALPEDQKFDELNYENIYNLNETIKENRENGLKSLVIMDDVQRALKDNQVVKIFKEMIANQRHLNCSFIILLQNYFALDNKVRELIHNVIFFKMDKKQNKKIFEEVAEMPSNAFYEINDFIFDEPYNWCLINQRNKKIYKMFDEVEIKDDDE
jgi:energy-coupling factor transporter ATP-binding protein EcfA2